MFYVGKIYINLTKLPPEFSNGKTEQLIAVALFEDNLCTYYLVNQVLIDIIFDESQMNFLQPQELVRNGFLGTSKSFYESIANINDSVSNQDNLFKYRKVEKINEKSYKKILNTNLNILTS